MARQKQIEYNTAATPRAVTTDGVPVFCAFDELISVQNTQPNPLNPNQHGAEQVRILGAIIRATGWRAPLTISSRSGLIVKGHGRRLAALNQSMTQIPVEYQDYANEAEEQADLLADNRLAELAEIDDKQLLDLLQTLGDEVPVELTGFDASDIEALLLAMTGSEAASEADVDSVPPEQTHFISEPGDIWNLGAHKLMCGSATDAAEIDRLMAGEKAQLVFTDPPYGVSYESSSGKFAMLVNDDLTGDALLRQLLQPAFEQYIKHTDPGAAFYVWHACGTRRDFEDALKAVGLLEKQYLIWVKPAPVLGRADYQWSHEPCFYMGKAGQTATFYGDRKQRTVWTAILKNADGLATTLTGGIAVQDGHGNLIYLDAKVPKGKKLRYVRLPEGKSITLYQESAAADVWEVSREHGAEHPTQKPVELATRALSNSSQTGDLVLDFFAGSGGVVIAAELLNRRCYAVELEPRYCDVSVRRFMELKNIERVTGTSRDGRQITFERAECYGDAE